ncbi:MAG: hypothetical protein HS116_07125 [Planctomycetes bacterium]|nr:hypothetical protein [Planctomycetota bacterium]
MANWKRAFESNTRHKFGFATAVVLDPKGLEPLGTSGSGYLADWEIATNYHADKFFAFLNASFARACRLAALQAETEMSTLERNLKLAALRNEVLLQIRAVNVGSPNGSR